MLEWAGVLTWQNRITRAVVRQRDLFGRWTHRWTVIRTSNAYVFRDPQPQLAGVPAAKSENPPGTQNQEIPGYLRPVLRQRIRGSIHRRYRPRRLCQPRQAAAGAESRHGLRQNDRPQEERRS